MTKETKLNAQEKANLIWPQQNVIRLAGKITYHKNQQSARLYLWFLSNIANVGSCVMLQMLGPR